MSIRCIDSALGEDWALYQGDCVQVCAQLPERSVDFSVYSPPFANLYCYSDSERDMGNCADDAEFLAHYGHLVRELYRVLRPGRIVAVHCKDLVNYKNRDGMAGLRDFPGDIIRVHTACQSSTCSAGDAERASGKCGHGFAYHSRVTVWKCPVNEMHKTKAHGLLYKQLRTDSTFSRQGLAEYVLAFRKWAQTDADDGAVAPVTHTEETFPLTRWQEWASPVWMDIDQTNVLNVQLARDDKDEKHMCPLQLDLIERCVKLWSNRGDVVLSPFAGIGSEGTVAVREQRRFIGIELKDSYFRRAAINMSTVAQQRDLFSECSP